jgi:apolipoprotein N-acyltransferase
MLARLVDRLLLAGRGRRVAYAVLAGALAALSLAPFHLFPVLVISFSVLVVLIDGATAGSPHRFRSAFLVGYAFGFGYFLAGLWWIGRAFLVDAEQFLWLMPIAVIAMPAGLALFTGFGTAIAQILWRPGMGRVLALAVGLSLADWLRGSVMTGFPWNAFGYGLAANTVLLQPAAWVGLYGMSFLAVMIFASPVLLAERRRAFPAVMATLLVALAGAGYWRIATAETGEVPGIRLKIMQPNLDQGQKWKPQFQHEIIADYVSLSLGADGKGLTGITHLIWPESAFPFFLTREADAMAQIADLLPPGTALITGSVRAPDMTPNARITRAYNSIYVIDHEGSVVSLYDKLHLVPFGEYLPLQNLLERLGLEQLTKVQGGFIPGTVRRNLDVPHAPRALPLICYEAIFPNEIASESNDRAGWMVNLTNDGWFGISTGPYQHLQQARWRAIEQGLPLVRAANTGISAVIDPLGRVIARLDLGIEGILDSALPAPIPPTPYARSGDLAFVILFVLSLMVVIRRSVAQKLP